MATYLYNVLWCISWKENPFECIKNIICVYQSHPNIAGSMCRVWKLLGAAALFVSLVYNSLISIILVTFGLRCYDDCNNQDPAAELDDDCYEAAGIYSLYFPTLFAMPLIILTEFRNTYYLQWWLTIQLVLTIVGVAVFVCYSQLYDKDVYITNLLAVVWLLMSFAFVAHYLFKIVQYNKKAIIRNTLDPNA